MKNCELNLEFFEIPDLNNGVYPKNLPEKGKGFLYRRPDKCLYYYDSYGVETRYNRFIKGTTNERPINLADSDSGLQYFDTTLKKIIIWTGEQWTDTNGNILN